MTLLNPREAPYIDYLILPVVLLLAKWSWPRLQFRTLYFFAAGIGWLLINLALKLSPPHNGFAYVVHLSLGWLWLLPVFGVLHGIHLFIVRVRPSLPNSSFFSDVTTYAFFAVIAAMLFLEGEALFGRVSESQAVETATRELYKHGVVNLGPPLATWKNGEWVVTFPGYESAVYVSRLGDLSGIGG